ncbi:MAG: ABC transporter permease, partial [Actinomycetota bacterium]|nr:ABC transporter permease [Actinomycetota bacterium]
PRPRMSASSTTSPTTPAAVPPHRRMLWLTSRSLARMLTAATPSVYVLVVLVVPIALIGLYSFGLRTNVTGVHTAFSTADWSDFLTSPGNPFRSRFFTSMIVTLGVSAAAVLGAFPLAYFLAFVAGRHRYTILLAVLAPFFTSYLLRVIAWQVILNNNGVINTLLYQLGLRAHGHALSWLIYSKFSVILVLFYAWVPFVALPIFVVLDNLDRRLLDAAHDLGAGRFSTFLRVTLPMSLPGVAAGFVFVLIPTTGEFIAPLLVGGPSSQLFGNSIQAFFSDTPDWNYGAVLALTLVAVVLVLLALFGRYISPDLTEETA